MSQVNSPSAIPRIAIIGAGLGGLTLARVLQTKGIPATIYERDQNSFSRSQGGTLDLHLESGQEAVRMADLFSEYEKIMRKEGQDTRVSDKHARLGIDFVADDDQASRPETDRGPLREIFIKKVNEGVRWGSRVKSVKKKADSDAYELTLADGQTAIYDLVVGADGAWSHVRPLLSDAVPAYTGVLFVEIHVTDVYAKHPAIASVVGRGTLFSFGDNKGILAQQNGDGRLRVYCALRVPENWPTECGIDWDNAPIARAKLLELFYDWSDSLTDMIRECDDFFWPRPLYALPTGHSWPHKNGLTLVGDAAHVMSPFAGEGANLAMFDGAKLAVAIAEGIQAGDIEGKIKEFEEDMFKRAAVAAQESASNLEICIADDAPKRAVENMRRMFAQLDHN